MAENWALDEVEAIVADYFAMLEAELSARPFSKAEHNREMQKRIPRNRSSIDYKYRNISAVLENFALPPLFGYKPQHHYQKLLEQVVLEWLTGHPEFFRGLADGPVLAPSTRFAVPSAKELGTLLVSPPELSFEIDSAPADTPKFRFYRTDFVRRDADNRRLGRLGEEWTLEYEQRRLHDLERRPDLAKRVEWVSETRGDGAGYDIASFNADATPRLIEVKTTGAGKYFPFLVTSNEVRVSEREVQSYHLYRVFQFATSPHLYVLQGALSKVCRLDPTQYRARIEA